MLYTKTHSKMANLGNNTDTLGSSDINELLDISDLTYLATPESNVVTSRQQIKQSMNEKYKAGEIITFVLETGQDYVSWPDSTFGFFLDLKKTDGTTTALTAKFGGGSILNIIKKITITSNKKMVELSKANLWNYYHDKLTHSHEWRTAQGGVLLGYGNDVQIDGARWVIPLSSICKFFDIDVLVPNVVTNGMTIDIELESVATAFVDAGGADAVGVYTVRNPYLRMDQYTLSGGAMNALNGMAATSGLVLNYKSVANAPYNKPAGIGKFTNKVTAALSMVNSAWSVVRVPQENDITKDSFESRPINDADAYNYKLGSTRMPEEDVVGIADWYNQAEYATSALKNKKELGLRQAEFIATTAVAAASVDRYWTSGSGMAINNSTSLLFNADLDDDALATVDTFVIHQVQSVSFMDNTTVFN